MDLPAIDFDSHVKSLGPQVLAGDCHAKEELFRIASDFASSFIGATRRGEQPANRDDVVQEIMIQVDRQIANFIMAENPKGWLKVLSYRAAIDYFRRNQGRALKLSFSPGNTSDELGNVPDPVAGPARDAENRDFIEKLMTRLSPDERRVVLLLLAGHKPAEIAALLGWHRANIGRLIERVRQKAKDLDDESPDKAGEHGERT